MCSEMPPQGAVLQLGVWGAAGAGTFHGLRLAGDLQRQREPSILSQLQPSQPLWSSDSAMPSAL